jgi:hypothetical protein
MHTHDEKQMTAPPLFAVACLRFVLSGSRAPEQGGDALRMVRKIGSFLRPGALPTTHGSGER